MDNKRIVSAFAIQDKVLDDALALIKELDADSRYYPLQNFQIQGGYIKLPSGLLIPRQSEEPKVLIKEFRGLLLNVYTTLLLSLRERIDDPLFDFAERTLVELTTKVLFIELSPAFDSANRIRLATLYLLHHEYNYGTRAKYMALKRMMKTMLTEGDLANLGSRLGNYIGDVVIPQLVQPHNDKQFALIDQFSPEFKHRFMQALHDRVHANPLSLNLSIGEIRPKATHMRRQTMLVYVSLQVLGYHLESLSDLNTREKWSGPIERYQSNFQEVRTVFDWLSKNNQ